MADFSQSPAGQTTDTLQLRNSGSFIEGNNGGILGITNTPTTLSGFYQSPAGQTTVVPGFFFAGPRSLMTKPYRNYQLQR